MVTHDSSYWKTSISAQPGCVQLEVAASLQNRDDITRCLVDTVVTVADAQFSDTVFGKSQAGDP